MKRNLIMYAALAMLVASSVIAMPKQDPADDGITTETFSCKGKRCTNEGGWEFIDLSSHVRKEKGGGKPRFYLAMNGPEFIPWVQSEMGADNAYHGNYRDDEVSRFSFDARTDNVGGFCGTERAMSVEIRNDGGTPGDQSDDCSVLSNVGTIPQVDEGWIHYDLAIPSADLTLPSTFEVSFTGGGCVGMTEDEAWNHVMQDVGQVRVCWEQCDFFSIECPWGVAIDNIEIEKASN